MPGPPPTPFEHYVNKTSTCWLWTGRRGRDGYGKFRVRGREVRAHRHAFEVAHGPAGDRLVLHRCDVPLCVNPDHLFLGNPQDNITDMIAKGRRRQPRYVRPAVRGRKLSEEQVSEIISRLKAGETQTALAKAFNVSQPLISQIQRGAAWKF